MKHIETILWICGLVCTLTWGVSSAEALGGEGVPQTDEPSTREILKRADESRGNLAGVEWTVQIEAVERDRVQDRELRVSARGYDFLASFVAPPKAKGQRVLFVQHNMWFAKLNVRKPVPVSSRQKLVGGAAYGDIAATNYADDYEAERLADEDVDDEPCYAFDLTAVAKRATYDRIKYWVSKSRNVAVKAEYYTVSGKLYKKAVFDFNHTVPVDSEVRPFISTMIVTDALQEGYVTTLQFSEPKLKELPDSMFNLNLLTRR